MRQYAGIPLHQLKALATAINGRQALENEWQALVANKPEKLWEILGSEYYWCKIYEYPVPYHFAMFLRAAGIDAEFLETLNSADHATSVVDTFLNLEQEAADSSEIKPSDLKILFGVWYSLLKTFDCILNYGLPLDVMVKRASQGDDKSLFNAIRIDRSILSNPLVADRLARAEIERDSAFFSKLSNALKGRSQKSKSEYGVLRYFLYLFNQDGTLDRMTMEERYEVLSLELNLYPSTIEDPARSLQTYIQRWRKAQ